MCEKARLVAKLKADEPGVRGHSENNGPGNLDARRGGPPMLTTIQINTMPHPVQETLREIEDALWRLRSLGHALQLMAGKAMCLA